MKQKNKTNILFRYAVISLAFLAMAAVIVIKLFSTTILNAKAWNDRAKKELSQVDTIAPTRGNILADNGAILACNVTVYDVKIDFRHKKMLDLDPISDATLFQLADSLDKYFPRRDDLSNPKVYEEYSWRKKLRSQLERPAGERSRALVVARGVTKQDYEKIRKFPIFADMKGKGTRVPIYYTERTKRIYPFGKMASLSIGRVYEQRNKQDSTKKGEIHGYSGLEKDLDTLLYGKPGLAKRVAITSGFTKWTTAAPVDGYNLLTTINIDMQDMLERELVSVCRESGAEWGTAIIMEVATGEIKAISNVELITDETGTDIKEDATYGEALNRAILAYEPGSVMKPISLMIAFEDGLVKNVTDIVDCSPFQRTSDPHAPGVKNMKQVIEMSSNTGIARVIFRGYASDPSKFHDRLASIGFFDPLHTGIAGETPPRIRKLLPQDRRGNNVTMTARHLDLARQAYGYNTEIPPLYTLSIYNAIANGGKFVRPHIVRGYRFNDGRDSILPITYIRERICSEETASKVRQCIREVVWGEHGTARAVRDDRIEIAGKTGTAFPVVNGVYDKSHRRYAFCGFFPYDNPKYTCMALVLAPGGTSANRTSGQVVKNMALKMYAHGMLTDKPSYTDGSKPSSPTFIATGKADHKKVKGGLNISSSKRLSTASAAAPGIVPDIKGYDAATAVALLEKIGLNVRLNGNGHVVGQSIACGTKVKRGDKITLTLRPS